MHRILITGGSGFIGTNLIVFLLKKEYLILNLDIKPPKLKTHNQIWKKIDINNLNDFEKNTLDFNPHFIIHLAARTDLGGKNLEDYKSNILGVENLMKVVGKIKDLRKVVITSSMLVCKIGYLPSNQKDYNPNTIYGESKVLTEKKVWENIPDSDWSIIRPTSIWGPWFDVPYKSFFEMILSKKYFHISNNSCYKTYGYIGNSIYQIERIMLSDTKKLKNKVFYIGDEPSINTEVWANEIGQEVNVNISKLPFCFFKILAYVGDFLNFFSIYFPMTSFRLKNMTTDNIIDLKNTYKLAPNPPFTRIEGVKLTLKWMYKN